MYIDLMERHDLLWGVSEVWQDKHGLILDRLNAGLRAHYADTEARVIRARCGACVRVAFRSDTRWVKISFRYNAPSRAFFQGELICGGRSRVFGPTEQVEEWAGEIFRARTRVPRDFVIWLPHLVGVMVNSLEIEDGAELEPLTPSEKRWLAIGDSITQGMTATLPTRTYVAVAARLARLNPHNIGVGGATMHPKVGEEARPIPCDLATIAFGVNDFNQNKPLSKLREDAIELLKSLIKGRETLPVGLITPFPWHGRTTPNDCGATLEDVRGVLREVAELFPNVQVIEGPELLPDEAEYFVDGVHPNDAGMRIIGMKLAPQLLDLLKTG